MITGAGGTGLLNALLPSGVAVSELFTDPPHIDLHPQEAAVVARAVDKRRREFAAVRLCARTALRRIGVPPDRSCRAPRVHRSGRTE